MAATVSATLPTREGSDAWPLGVLETSAWKTPQGKMRLCPRNMPCWSILHLPRPFGVSNSQIPPDLVVKSQVVDIAEVI